ncbi:MAG: hypothetical protein ACE5H9_17980 [Anaerolineae bacterium]
MLTLLLVFYFWAGGVSGLDRFPKIHEDESWQSAPGYTFWAEGRFGSDLFAGFFGMERHYYGFMPLFPILVGGGLHLFGLGLFQARLAPLALITLAVAVTHRLGWKLFSPWHGTLAVAVLVGWRIAGPFAHLRSGLPLADVARIVRYDSAVPVFGLTALLALVGTLKTQNSKLKIQNFFGIGLLAGLATLSHLYGGFWLPALALSLVWVLGRRAIGPVLAMGLGFGLVLTPYVWYVASGWGDFLLQNRNYADRFGLLDPRFYLINLLGEVERYDPLLNGAKGSLGAWLWLIACSLSLLWLARRAWADRAWQARVLIAALATLGFLFAVLLRFKTFSYLAMLWPLFALAIASGFIYVWQANVSQRWWRPVLALCFVLALAEGGLANWRFHLQARQATPYQTYTRAIAARLPPGSRVMGMHHYWLGLFPASRDYRSIAVPVIWTSPQYVAEPVSFGQAAQAIPPDVILLDQIMLDFLDEIAEPDHPLHSLGLEIDDYLARRQATLITEIDDPTYGRIQIYQLDPAAP